MRNGALTLAVEPGAACAVRLPMHIPDAAAVPAGPWAAIFTDGAGDLAATYHDDRPGLAFAAPLNIRICPADGSAPVDLSADGNPVPDPEGFLWPDTFRGPCMVCATALWSWPSTKSLFVGDGYPWHGSCTFELHVSSDAVCKKADFMGQGAEPPSLQQFDDSLARVAVTPNVSPEPVIVAVDRLDRIVSGGSGGQRWIAVDSTPLSDWFDADATGALPLIGGGLLTNDDLVIASGKNDVRPAPDWLRGHANRADIVLGGNAYAFPEERCAADIYDAGGVRCGTVTVAGCASAPRFGLDGSAIVHMADGTWQIWRRLLQ
jgi:hypothetical protein